MKDINDNFFAVLNSKNFKNYTIVQQCHEDIEKDLSREQKIAADVLYWLRNLNMGREVCIKFSVYPGPYGILDKKSKWFPLYLESCDDIENMQHSLGVPVNEKSTWLNPWSIFKHCKSLQHCQYMVKYRLHHLYNKIQRFDHLISLAADCSLLPLFINGDDRDILAFFAKRSLDGTGFDMNKKY
jgi:hypothetical protein